MEVTPQDARSVKFREKLRGYHPEDVDAFVTRVADTLESLHSRVRDANARADEAERRAQELAETEESVRRTLVLAQKTADEAIRDAQEEAQRLMAEAQARHDEVIEESERLRREMAGAAEAEIQADLERLAEARQRLEDDARVLHAHIAEERSKLRALLEHQLQTLEEDRWRPAATEPSEDAGSEEPGGNRSAEPGEAEVDAEHATGSFETNTEAVADTADGDEEDSFLAELRRAADDDTPLGPRDDEPGEDGDDDPFFDGDDGGRFGSPFRRRR